MGFGLGVELGLSPTPNRNPEPNPELGRAKRSTLSTNTKRPGSARSGLAFTDEGWNHAWLG